MMNYGGLGGMWGGAGSMGMLATGLIWLGIVLLVVWGVTVLAARRSTPAERSALEVLRHRYASGELTEAEFQQAKRVLA